MDNNNLIRYRIELSGRIQNCGFRSFCWKCAKKAAVTGWVSNDDTNYTKVQMEVQGTDDQIGSFIHLIYQGNGWSRITSEQRRRISVIEEEKSFVVLR